MLTPEFQALLDQIHNTEGVEASAVVAFQGIAGRLNTLASQLAGTPAADIVQQEANTLKDSTDKLVAALTANSNPSPAPDPQPAAQPAADTTAQPEAGTTSTT